MALPRRDLLRGGSAAVTAAVVGGCATKPPLQLAANQTTPDPPVIDGDQLGPEVQGARLSTSGSWQSASLTLSENQRVAKLKTRFETAGRIAKVPPIILALISLVQTDVGRIEDLHLGSEDPALKRSPIMGVDRDLLEPLKAAVLAKYDLAADDPAVEILAAAELIASKVSRADRDKPYELAGALGLPDPTGTGLTFIQRAADLGIGVQLGTGVESAAPSRDGMGM